MCKPGGKRRLGRPNRRWDDNIQFDLQEVGCGYRIFNQLDVRALTGLIWLRIGTGGLHL